MSAKLFALAGTPLRARGGDVSPPSQVYLAGISESAAEAVDVIDRPMVFPDGSGSRSGSLALLQAAMMSTAQTHSESLIRQSRSLRAAPEGRAFAALRMTG